MKKYLLGLALAALGYSQLFGQCQLEALPIHAEHWSYLKEHSITDITVAQIQADVAKSGLTYGATFKITGISKERIQVQLLPSGKSGELKDSVLLALYECSNSTLKRIYHRVDRVKKPSNGQPLRIVAQALNIDVNKEYYAVVAGTKINKSFTIRTTQEFRTNRFRSVDLNAGATEIGKQVIGRVTDQNGNPVKGETVHLYNAEHIEIQQTTTDEKGEFHFEKLPNEEAFIAKLDESESDLKLDMYLFDEVGKRQDQGVAVGQNEFAFLSEEKVFSELELLSKADYAIYPDKNKIGIAGRVVDKETYLFGSEGAEIVLLDKHNNELTTTLTDRSGRFYFNNLDKGDYSVRILDVRTDLFTELVIVDDMNVPLETTSSNLMDSDGNFKFKKLPAEKIALQRLAEEEFEADETDFTMLLASKSVILKHVYFESGQAQLLPSSFNELDDLCEYLTGKEGLTIRISGHTDNTGGNELNLSLSESRAKAVYDYLIQCNVDQSRLSYIGFGKSKHIVSNISEEGRKRNRRVEIEVMK